LLKTESGNFIFNKPYGPTIIQILALTMRPNPKYSLYIWFKFMFPTILDKSGKHEVRELCIKYIEVFSESVGTSLYNKVPLDVEEATIDFEDIHKLLDYKYTDFGKKIDKSLAKLFKLVMFSKDSSTEKYFPGLLKLVSKLEEGEEEKKIEIYDLLSNSVLRNGNVRKEWLDIYFLHVSTSSNIMANIITNWKSYSEKIPPKTKDTVKKELLTLMDDILEINDKLSKGEYKDSQNQMRSMKKLGIKPAALQVVNETSTELKNLFNAYVTDEEEETSQKSSPILLYIAIFVVLVSAGIGAYFYLFLNPQNKKMKK